MKPDIHDIEVIYIAGPMRGYPRYNFDAFCQAASDLRMQGYRAINPAEVDIDQDGFDPDDDAPFDWERWKRVMGRDLNLVSSVDALVMLDGWEKSQGARLEAYCAREFKLPVLSYPDLLPLDIGEFGL